MRKNYHGFTLVELAVVLVIIGVLAAIVLVNVGSFTVQGRDTKRVGDLRNLQPLLAQYQLKTGEYPSVSSENILASGGLAEALVTAGIIPAVSSISRPPRSADVYRYWTCSSSGFGGPLNHYILGTDLEQTRGESPQLYSNAFDDNDFSRTGWQGCVPTNPTCGSASDPANRQYCVAF